MEKTVITPQWLKIKAKFDSETKGSKEYGTNFEIDGEFQEMCNSFINILGKLTEEYGFDYVVEDISLDLFKNRIWNLVECAGLLKPY